MNRLIAIVFIVGGLFTVKAQELNCQVSIITDVNIATNQQDLANFELIEAAIYELMNGTRWTKDEYEIEERINCNIQLQINEIPSPGTYGGSIQIQSSRPAFNSSYNTTVFNFQDDNVLFSYSPNLPLRYAPNRYDHELSSILAFYAYFILGMDYDSFSLKGGTKHFTMAQEIVSQASVAGGPGWKSNERGQNNRYWLVDNALHELFSPLRVCNYEYHRKGLDILYENNDAGRNAIYMALNKLVKIAATRPNSINLINFVQAKSNELKNLYADSEVREKNQIVSLLKRIDPANSSKYQEILN